MRDARLGSSSIPFVSCLIGLAMSIPALGDTEPAAGAIVEFNAGNNPGASSNTWAPEGTADTWTETRRFPHW